MLAAKKAILRLVHTAERICRSRNSSPYQWVEKPAHTVTRRDELNE